MLARLDAKGIERRFVTLHVGLGTFLPVREENIENHKMHEEWYTVPKETADAINKAKPSSLKGQYIKSISLAPTMGPGVKVNVAKVTQ